MHTSPQKIGMIYFIGIGGIGMSGIAEVLHNLGYHVAGSDVSQNYNVERLQKLGILVHTQHDAYYIKEAAVIVVSTAVKSNNPELIAARKLGIPVIRRADMLAELMRLKPCIAISGTHGKTTTTSLAAAVLDQGGYDPTVVNGGIINAYGTNARLGTGEWMVVEADESDGSFTSLPPTIGIITNIDPEHLDHYQTFDNAKAAFVTFFKNIPFYGLGILCIEHRVVERLLSQFQDRRRITYGFRTDADVYAHNLRFSPEGVQFDCICNPSGFPILKRSTIYWDQSQTPYVFSDITIALQGEHNVLNSLAAIVTGLELGISIDHIKKALGTFAGVKRRFTLVEEIQGRKIIDDYAHHPVEIATVLKAARNATRGQVIAIAQPHRYTRVRDLFTEFANCFSDADILILAPIYSAGEDPIPGITQKELGQEIQKTLDKPMFIVKDKKEVIDLIAKYSRKGDIIIYMGAGDVTYWAYEAPQLLTSTLA